MRRFENFWKQMRETLRGALFLASLQIPVALLGLISAAAVLATMVLVLAPAVVAVRLLFGH
jgi:hypothetical protein